MRIPVSDSVDILQRRGLVERAKSDDSDRVIDHMKSILGRDLPPDLEDFYRERIEWVGEFPAIWPTCNDHVGWRPLAIEMTTLLHASAVPVFLDGFGNLFGLDLREDNDTPGVYFFDATHGYEAPEYAAGSSLGAFVLLLADRPRAFDEDWPERWELRIDPDIDRCPRARAIWNAG